MEFKLNLTGRCPHCRRPFGNYEVEVIDEVYLEGRVHYWFNLARGPVMMLDLMKPECSEGELKLKDARWMG